MGTRRIAKDQPKPPTLKPCLAGKAHHMVGDEPNGTMTVRAVCKHCQQETWWFSSHRLDREGTFAAREARTKR